MEAVKVHATVSLNEDVVKQSIEQEMMYVIITTDTERDWTMAELLGTIRDRVSLREVGEYVKNLASLLT